MLAGVQDPVAQRKRGTDPGRAAQGRQPTPAQPEAEQVGEALARMQPQVQPDPDVTGSVAGQVPGRDERPGEDGGQDQDDGQRDGVLDDHRGSPFCAARTALRSAVRAAPVFRSAAGARAALIEATRSRGMEASGPYRSATKERKRAVFVSPPALATCGERTTWSGDADAARRPGATGHSARTQARNPARVDLGARARRSSHKISPPRMASGVAVSPARAACRCWWRVRAQARTTAMRVSLARA